MACWTADCGNDQESIGQPEALEELVHSAGASSSLLGGALVAAAALPKKFSFRRKMIGGHADGGMV